MKKINQFAMMAITAFVIQSCAGTRNTTSTNTGPTGPITPSTGSASNISAGRNTAAAPVSGSQGSISATSSGVTADNGVSGEIGANNGTRASSGNAIPANGTAPRGDTNMPSENNKSGKAKDNPEYFMNAAAVMGMSDVRLSEYALTKSSNTAIKAFATMVTKEHGDVNIALKSLATSKNLTLPNPDSLGTDSEIKMKKLSAASPADFDGEFIEMMIADHESAIDLFEQGAKSKDPEVKAFAKKNLPILQMHLKTVKSFMGN